MQLSLQLSKLQGTTSYFDENVGRVGVKSDTVYNEGYVLLQEVCYCTGITNLCEIIVYTFSVSVSISFCMFPCSIGHSIGAYLITI